MLPHIILPPHLEIQISILSVEEVELNGANSNHLPHSQASKWWSYRDPALLSSKKGRIWVHHLPSLTASSKLYPSHSTPSPSPLPTIFSSNTVGGSWSAKENPVIPSRGLCLHHPAACLLLKMQFSENGMAEAGLGSGHLQGSRTHPLHGKNQGICCFVFQAVPGQLPTNVFTK